MTHKYVYLLYAEDLEILLDVYVSEYKARAAKQEYVDDPFNNTTFNIVKKELKGVYEKKQKEAKKAAK